MVSLSCKLQLFSVVQPDAHRKHEIRTTTHHPSTAELSLDRAINAKTLSEGELNSLYPRQPAVNAGEVDLCAAVLQVNQAATLA